MNYTVSLVGRRAAAGDHRAGDEESGRHRFTVGHRRLPAALSGAWIDSRRLPAGDYQPRRTTAQHAAGASSAVPLRVRYLPLAAGRLPASMQALSSARYKHMRLSQPG